MKYEELKIVLENHIKWLKNDGGERADLYEANLREADLYEADLREANLRGADLRGADLRGADLYEANLREADLYEADLYEANLRGADLRGADLREADLYEANLYEADLREAIGISLNCPEEGSFLGFKKARNHLVKLHILEESKRSSATSRKCRCNKAQVLEIIDLTNNEKVSKIASSRDTDFIYEVGKDVSVNNFNEDRWIECTTGIHFFITKQEALDY